MYPARSRALLAPIAAAVLAALVGCGYGFSSSLLPAHIKTVAVPLMENATNRAELSAALADSLTEAFLDDNKLRVVDEREADSVVEGKIVEYRWTPFSWDENEQVQQYRVEIVLEARYVDLRKNDVRWEEARLSQWDTYNFIAQGGEPAETEEVGIGRVLAKLTEDIRNRTVEGW